MNGESETLAIRGVLCQAPTPSQVEGFAETQVKWTNKHEFMSLALSVLEGVHAEHADSGRSSGKQDIGRSTGTGLPEKQYS